MRTARARRSPGTCSRCCKPEGPGQADGLPRDHQGGDPAAALETRARSTTTSSTPRRPAASSTASTATRSRPVLWQQGHARPVRRPRAVRRDPAGRRARARADGLPSARRYWDLDGDLRRRRARRRTCSPPSSLGVDGERVATRPRLRPTTGTLKGDRQRPARRGSRPPRSPRRCAAPRSSVAAVGRRASRTRRRPSAPFTTTHAAAGGQPQAAASAPQRRCASPSGCTRTATSPTCVPTRTTLSDAAVDAPRVTRPASCTAPSTCPTRPRIYATKVKNAQEAHEAIRPAGRPLPHPDADRGLSCAASEFRLYELIWKRTVASQMADAARPRSVTIAASARDGAPTGEDVVFSATGTRHHLPRLPQGLRRGPRRRSHASRDDAGDAACPRSAQGDAARPPPAPRPRATRPSRRRATPRRRWSRSSRSAASAARRRTPRSSARSWTAATSTRRAPRWCPAWLAFAVIRLLEEHFARLVDYEFTASMEDDLDDIAGGRRAAGRRAAPRSTSAPRRALPTGCTTLVDGPRRHRRPRASRPSRSATASSCGSAATARTSRRSSAGVDRDGEASTTRPRQPRQRRPTTCRPTS